MPKQKYLTMRERNLTREEIAELLETLEAHTIFEKFKVAGRLKWKKEVKRPVDCLPFFFVIKGFAGWHPTEFLAAVMLEKYDQMLTFPQFFTDFGSFRDWEFARQHVGADISRESEMRETELEAVIRMAEKASEEKSVEILGEILGKKCKIEKSNHTSCYLKVELDGNRSFWLCGAYPRLPVLERRVLRIHVGGYAFVFPTPVRLSDAITEEEFKKWRAAVRSYTEKVYELWQKRLERKRFPACKAFTSYLSKIPEIRTVTTDLLVKVPRCDFVAFPKIGSDFPKPVYAVEVKSQKSKGGPYGFWVPGGIPKEIGILLIQMFIREDNRGILVKYRAPTFQKS